MQNNFTQNKSFFKKSIDIDTEKEFKYFYTFFALFIYATILVDYFRVFGDLWVPFLSNYIEFIRNGIYILIFFYMLYFLSTKHIKMDFLWLNFISIIIILISYLISSEISALLPEFLLFFYSRAIPAYFFARNTENCEKLLVTLKRFLWIGFFYGFLVLLDNRPKSYMSVSYNLLIVALIALCCAYRNKIYFLLHFYFVFLILIYGARGPLACLLGCYVLLYLMTLKNKISVKKVILVFSVLFLCGGTIVIYLNQIINYLYQKFPNSRTLWMITSGILTSGGGRSSIQKIVLTDLMNSPFQFHGILMDRIIVTNTYQMQPAMGYYPHNIFLEILYQFGIPIGILILAFFISVIIKSFVICKKESLSNKLCYLLFVPTPVVESLFSGSYLNNFLFWLALGFIFRVLDTKKRETEMKIQSPNGLKVYKNSLNFLK